MSVSPVPTSDSKAEVECACATGMANSAVCQSGSAALRMISAGASPTQGSSSETRSR
jgi:hypothetical protein